MQKVGFSLEFLSKKSGRETRHMFDAGQFAKRADNSETDHVCISSNETGRRDGAIRFENGNPVTVTTALAAKRQGRPPNTCFCEALMLSGYGIGVSGGSAGWTKRISQWPPPCSSTYENGVTR